MGSSSGKKGSLSSSKTEAHGWTVPISTKKGWMDVQAALRAQQVSRYWSYQCHIYDAWFLFQCPRSERAGEFARVSFMFADHGTPSHVILSKVRPLMDHTRLSLMNLTRLTPICQHKWSPDQHALLQLSLFAVSCRFGFLAIFNITNIQAFGNCRKCKRGKTNSGT